MPQRTIEDDRLERVRKLKGLPPIVQPEVTPPPDPRTQPYLQAQQLEQEAQPRDIQPHGIKENIIAGIQGAFHPGGYQGMMLQNQQLERQREQDLLSRVKELRGEGFQQQQLYRQSQNDQLDREYQDAQLEQVKRLRDLEERKANQPEEFASSPQGIFNRRTGKVTTPAIATSNDPASIQQYHLWASQQKRGADTSWHGYQKDIADATRAPVREGSITPTAEAGLVQQLNKQWETASKDVQALYRANTIMDAGMAAARRGDMNAGAQAVLVTFQKFLDPQSVVRESEYARSPEGLAMAQRIRGWYERNFEKGGAGVPLPELEAFAQLAKEINTRLAAEGASLLDAERKRITSIADRYKIPPELAIPNYDYSQPAGATKTTNPSGLPAVGSTFNGAKVISVTPVN